MKPIFLSLGTVAVLLAIGPVPAGAADSVPTARAYCRYVPERAGDFAWENDLVAFRMYGPPLEKSAEDSGVDCWLKRVTYPIIDKWYKQEAAGQSYHVDHGEGYDAYKVGRSRGCGGLAVWKHGRMYPSNVFKQWRVLTNGPERCVFELRYQWEADGDKIVEAKRISLALGQRLFESDSKFTVNGQPAELDIAIGLATHGGKAKARFNPASGWIACWEVIDGQGLGTGVVIAPDKVRAMTETPAGQPDEPHALLLTRTDANGRLHYRAGYGWEKAGAITSLEKWEAYLRDAAAAKGP